MQVYTIQRIFFSQRTEGVRAITGRRDMQQASASMTKSWTCSTARQRVATPSK